MSKMIVFCFKRFLKPISLAFFVSLVSSYAYANMLHTVPGYVEDPAELFVQTHSGRWSCKKIRNYCHADTSNNYDFKLCMKRHRCAVKPWKPKRPICRRGSHKRPACRWWHKKCIHVYGTSYKNYFGCMRYHCCKPRYYKPKRPRWRSRW